MSSSDQQDAIRYAIEAVLRSHARRMQEEAAQLGAAHILNNWPGGTRHDGRRSLHNEGLRGQPLDYTSRTMEVQATVDGVPVKATLHQGPPRGH